MASADDPATGTATGTTAATAAAIAEAQALVQRRHIDLLRVNSALCRR